MPFDTSEFSVNRLPGDHGGPALPPFGFEIEISAEALRRVGLHPRQRMGFDVAGIPCGPSQLGHRDWARTEVTVSRWLWCGADQSPWGVFDQWCLTDRPMAGWQATVLDSQSVEWFV